VREIDPGAVAQAAIAADIERLKVGLAHDREPAFEGKASILLPVQRPFGAVVDVHVIHIRIHHPTEGRLAIDPLDRQDIRIEEPHVTPDALIIRGGALDGRVCPGIGRLPILGVEVLQVPGGQS
jgi:hypothetical protein